MLAHHCWETRFLGRSGQKRAKSPQAVQYDLEVIKNLVSQHYPQNVFCNLFGDTLYIYYSPIDKIFRGH